MLRISTLGPLIISLDGEPVHTFKTTKALALLIFLAVEKDRDHSRESLMELLWPDMPLESAQVNLRQTVYRLRQSLPQVDTIPGVEKVPILQADRQTIRIHPGACANVDIDDFLSSLEENPEQAVEYYRGDFLSDFYLADSNPFEDWAERIRQDPVSYTHLTLPTN